MKKIVLMSLLMLSAAFSQFRVGADVSREMTLGGLEGEKAEGMGYTLGYEKMLLGLIGLGGEFSLGGDEGPDMVYGYGVARVPVGLPFFRGVVRMGYSLPVGEDGEDFDPRIKILTVLTYGKRITHTNDTSKERKANRHSGYSISINHVRTFITSKAKFST